MESSRAASDFDVRFSRAARAVRSRLTFRNALNGVTWGLCAGALMGLGLWWLGPGELRPFTAMAGLVGGAIGVVATLRGRWTDEEVALYLDERLRTGETIVTAVGLRAAPSEAARHLRVLAARTLAERLPSLSGPKLFGAEQLLVPAALAAITWVSLLPMPRVQVAAKAPGAEHIQHGSVKGLERIEALAKQKGPNPEDEQRLRALADEAKKLRGELARGMEKREALSRMAKLRDSIAELRADFGGAKNRAGLEAAIGALAEHPELRGAARALGDGDLTEFDREMQRKANLAEESSRQSAKQALEEAEARARATGAEKLADMLKEQRQAFDQRSAEAEALRELSRLLQGELSPEALEDLKEFGQSGDPEAARRLSEALGKALSKLNEEERKRLAEQLQQRMNGLPDGNATPLTREELKELAKRLASPEAQRELEQRLRELAEAEPTPGADRDGALGEAERGLGEAEKGLAGVPLPMAGSGGPGPGGPEGSGPGNGPPGGPGSRGGDRGNHEGESKRIDAPELRAKANAIRSGVGPMHAATLGRAPARAGDTANQRGTASLGSLAPAEIGAVEQSEVPEEYREHVGRYFEP